MKQQYNYFVKRPEISPRDEVLRWLEANGGEGGVTAGRVARGVRPALSWITSDPTALFWQTVHDLVDEGLVEVTCVRTGKSGRPPMVVRLNGKDG